MPAVLVTTVLNQAHLAQLKMLRYQLNPHFLFNTLNVVSTLILDIEKARFGDRPSLRYELGPDVQNALLPSLLLKPLVENSIKYAVSQSIDGGQIEISALNCAGKLELIVSDNGPGMQAETLGATKKSVGVGRCNIAIWHKLIAYCVPYCYG